MPPRLLQLQSQTSCRMLCLRHVLLSFGLKARPLFDSCAELTLGNGEGLFGRRRPLSKTLALDSDGLGLLL